LIGLEPDISEIDKKRSLHSTYSNCNSNSSDTTQHTSLEANEWSGVEQCKVQGTAVNDECNAAAISDELVDE
jgi:hypothetical protein